MKKLCMVLCLLSISASAFAAGQPGMGIQTGEKEISGQFSVMNSSGGDVDMTMWMLMGSFGYFITPQVQLKGSGLLFATDAADTTMLNGSIGVGADYLFVSNMQFIPYAGGDVLVTASDSDAGGSDVGLGLDIHGGMKQFITESTAINYEVRLMRDFATDSNWLMFMVGLNIYIQ